MSDMFVNLQSTLPEGEITVRTASGDTPPVICVGTDDWELTLTYAEALDLASALVTELKDMSNK